MTLNLFTLQNSPRAAVKQLTAAGSATGTLKKGSSIHRPVIERVQLDSVPAGVNYFEIPEFGRHYFVTDISADDVNGLWRISGHSDVLAYAWPKIGNSGGIVRRNTKLYNLYLPDDKLPLQSRRSPEIQTFSKGFTGSQSGSCCCLVLMGAGFSGSGS